jgi:hypothetical protein
MRSISTALANHLASEVATVATLWKITRTDGQVFGFTDHDQDLVLGGITYASNGGYTSSAIVWSDNLSTSNQEVSALIDNPAIFTGDVLAGLWDYASVTLYLVNYADVSMGVLPLTTGLLGQVTLKRGQFVAELRGLAQLLSQEIGSLYSATCRAQLGDAKCKVPLGPLSVSGSVTALVAGGSQTRIFEDSSLTQVGPTLTYTSQLNLVPSTSPFVLSPMVPQGGSWVSDAGVSFVQTGKALTAVGTNPGKGQYCVNNGVYTFSFQDAGAKVTITFNYAQGYFTYGLLTWLTGQNAGYRMDVRNFSPGRVMLALPMAHPIAVGDTYSLVAGCDKNASTCKLRFNNFVNFRGEPYIPGTDAVLRPQSK